MDELFGLLTSKIDENQALSLFLCFNKTLVEKGKDKRSNKKKAKKSQSILTKFLKRRGANFNRNLVTKPAST